MSVSMVAAALLLRNRISDWWRIIAEILPTPTELGATRCHRRDGIIAASQYAKVSLLYTLFDIDIATQRLA